MKLPDLAILLKHAPAMRSVQVCHPDNCTRGQRLELWLLVRWAHTQERFGDAGVAEIILSTLAGDGSQEFAPDTVRPLEC